MQTKVIDFMNNFRLKLQQFSARFLAGVRHFMSGRYGMDKLNMAILCAGLVASILSMLTSVQPFNLIFWALSYGLMIWAICRSLSRNTYKRYQENRKFLQIFDRCNPMPYAFHRRYEVFSGNKGKVIAICIIP